MNELEREGKGKDKATGSTLSAIDYLVSGI